GRRGALADRNAHDDEVGAFNRRRVGVDDLIRDAELHDAAAGLRRARRRHDAADKLLRPRCAGDRRADQADPDQRKAAEGRVGRHEPVAYGPPPLEGEGRTAEGSPGRSGGGPANDGEAAYGEAPSPPPDPLTPSDLSPPGGGGSCTICDRP